MKTLLVFLLVVGCNAGDFSTAVPQSAKSSGEEDLRAAGVIAEGMNYEGDPIVFKDPPDDNYALYTKISSEWKARVVATKNGSHELNGTTHRERVTIESLVATRQNVQSESQIIREKRQPFIHRQRGQNSNTASESLTQENRGILDILLAIDNSGSMGGEIGKVKENLGALLTNIGDSNWQIAMVKSEPSGSCLVEGLITSQTAEYPKAYKNLFEFDLEGGNEHMLKKVRWALEGKSDTGCKGNWLREGSTVAVIVVSDERHQCPDQSVCSVNAYRTFVSNFGRGLKTYGFTDHWSAADRDIFVEHGSTTGDYSATLQRISADVQANLKDIFTLAATPDGKSMTVSVNGTAVPSCNDIQMSGCYEVVNAAGSSAVQFVGYTPPKNASIDIDYTYGGIDFDTEWTLPHVPHVDTMTVTVTKDGTETELERGTHYNLDGRVLRVTSSNVLPQGATLKVDYLENIALKTSFTLTEDTGLLHVSGATVVLGTVAVHISDGTGKPIKTLTSGFDFDGTTLTFTDTSQVPAAGIEGTKGAEKFTIAYDYRHGKKTSYSFIEHHELLANSDALSCHNETQDNTVDCVSDSSSDIISFADATQFAVDDVIVITEQLLQQGNNFPLGKGWIQDEAVELELTGGKPCTIPSNFIDKDKDKVMLEEMTSDMLAKMTTADADCSFMQDLQPNEKQMISYTYRVYKSEAEDFLQMRKSFFSNHYGKYKFEYWEVLINNVRTNKFTVKDYSVVLDEEGELGKNSTVGVTVYLYHAL